MSLRAKCVRDAEATSRLSDVSTLIPCSCRTVTGKRRQSTSGHKRSKSEPNSFLGDNIISPMAYDVEVPVLDWVVLPRSHRERRGGYVIGVFWKTETETKG
jgi:hypothetical protein